MCRSTFLVINYIISILRNPLTELHFFSESVDGGFTDWSNWTVCSVTCGGGNQTRNRTCSNPEPQNGGKDCVGDFEETQSCNTDTCPPGNCL